VVIASVALSGPASASLSRVAHSATAAKAAAPTAVVSADRRYLAVNLDRRYRASKVTVSVRLRSSYVALGAVRLDRNGDGRLRVPVKRVSSMKAGLVVRFVRAGKTIGTASTRKALPARLTPKPAAPAPVTPVPPAPAPVMPVPPVTPVPPVPAPPLPIPPAPTLPDVAPQDFSGSGDQVVALASAAARPFLATVSGVGTSNLIVWAVDSTGKKSDLVVNEIGSYPTSTLLVDVPVGSTVYGFEVTATGFTWSIQVRPLTDAASWLAGQTSGQGSTVLATGPVTGITSLALTNVGQSNFIVWAYDVNGRRVDLLVNEIGNYSGTVLMPVGTRYLSIESSGGSWSASRS
jgi:hypothetical protein